MGVGGVLLAVPAPLLLTLGDHRCLCAPPPLLPPAPPGLHALPQGALPPLALLRHDPAAAHGHSLHLLDLHVLLCRLAGGDSVPRGGGDSAGCLHTNLAPCQGPVRDPGAGDGAPVLPPPGPQVFGENLTNRLTCTMIDKRYALLKPLRGKRRAASRQAVSLTMPRSKKRCWP